MVDVIAVIAATADFINLLTDFINKHANEEAGNRRRPKVRQQVQKQCVKEQIPHREISIYTPTKKKVTGQRSN